MSEQLINLFYLISSVLFILGLKGLTSPRTAVRGNFLGSLGMLIAIVVTLLDHRIISYGVIVAGMLTGGLVGAVMAQRAPMTAMPQLVAVFNGFGGGASALGVGAALEEALKGGFVEEISLTFTTATALSGLIGGLSLTGSAIAFGKLQGIVTEKPVLLPMRHQINAALLVATLVLGFWLILFPTSSTPFWALMFLSAVLGLMLVIAIGGADMPVVIALLNSYSGIAAAGHGWVLDNSVLIIVGSLVGASGFILTALMSKAMNRSLPNIIFGGLGAVDASTDAAEEDIYAGRVKAASPEEIAMLLDGARRVVFVPGYGMAVAHAQYAIQEFAETMEKNGTEVEFAIHPVAGRMPGHMNVLLAEANVPYDRLKEMDEINPSFKQTDVVFVVGANDVVNPLARDADPSIPIAGMPILDVDAARTVVVIKRSLSHGFAGIANPLFAADNTLMLFGDAKEAALELTRALNEA